MRLIIRFLGLELLRIEASTDELEYVAETDDGESEACDYTSMPVGFTPYLEVPEEIPCTRGERW